MTKSTIVGCGYVGTRLAQRLMAAGHSVQGWVRSAASAAQLAAVGIPSVAHDLLAPEMPPPELVTAGGALFHCAPPPDEGTEDPHTRQLVALFARTGQPQRIVYISTTSVYGDCQGAWVDETRPVQPQAERAHRRWDAEQTLRQWRDQSGGELVILRVAGIYGPERLPLARIRQGVPLVRTEDAPYTNRIHVDDLVTVCVAAMERGADGAVYNACDGHPSTMTDYFLAVASAAGLPAPPLLPLATATPQLSAGMRSYLAESRRLSNRKLCEELGVELRYPNLALGLQALF